ncbi:MAG: cell division protein [Rhodoglobus sp.]|nr:cell division protein [Rhodoglobus sp.]
MWMLTSSPFALAFAALGPVTAVASLLDSRIGSRRAVAREARRFGADAERVRAEIAERHSAERDVLVEATPSAAELSDSTMIDSGRWRADASEVIVALGTGTIRSALEFERPALGAAGSAVVESTLAELAALAAMLDGAPVRVDARLGLGICGSPPMATALARAVALQLARALSPAVHRWWCSASGGELWMTALPHARAPALERADHWIAWGTDQPAVAIAVADHETALPAWCRVVVRVDESGGAILQHPDRNERREFRPGVISREQALTWSRTAARDAARRGISADGSAVPTAVGLAPLLRYVDRADRSLACEVAVAHAGPVTLDLVEHGPHAIVGGTTGSGKSELLISWVLAMAAAHPPDRVTFLLVDFKGGSAFSSLEALPHSVGIITDLDETQASRALESLRAELRYREAQLASHGAKGIEQLEGLPRLVIVVDEFAAMMSDHPDLHALFADLAARGRSLGVHLILCTQRPAGVVRDSVLANADLRISLRVNNRSDSSAVVGTDAAAAIPAQARGRGVVALAGQSPATVQFAMADAEDAAAVASRFENTAPPRRPWCEPLPPVVVRPLAVEERGAETGIPFGLVDLPREQRRGVAQWHPTRDGHLLILGAAGSGCSTAIAAFGTPERIPAEIAAAWDALTDLVSDLDESSGRERLIALDDADSLLARLSPDYRAAFVERLCRVLRDGPARGIRLVLAAQRITADLQPVTALVPARLFLRHASRHEFVLAGGDGRTYLEGLPPGGGLWRGDRVQVVAAPVPLHAPVVARVVDLDSERPIAVATTRSGPLTARLRRAGLTVVELASSTADPRELAISSGQRRTALVGDVDEWQSRWGVLTALRPVAEVLLDGCGIADVRALTRSRQLPPPLDGDSSLCWRIDENGGISRARLPSQENSLRD